MKKLFAAMTVLACLLAGLFGVPASAESNASRVDVYATVNADGDCMVSLTATVHLETSNGSLTFPLPPNASDISLNGSAASVTRSSASTDVQISKVTSGIQGDYTLRFDYTLKGAVAVGGETLLKEKILQLSLPLLCGFSYPVQNMSFVITLPGTISADPVFTSTYRQGAIDVDMTVVVNGNMITGSVNTGLNDHEAISMTLVVPKDQFPTVSTYQREGTPELVPMLAIAGAALLYWLLFLRTLPPARGRSVYPPEGCTAGETDCRLTLTGADLTMTVLSWAQMGYLIIHLDENGRVLLHKRMDMGNERSLFEIRIFGALFGSRRVVDATGVKYALLRRKVAAMLPGEAAMCKSKPFHRQVFRLLCCASQVMCGICMALNFTTQPVLMVLLSIVLGALGAAAAWQMQNMAFCLRSRRKTPVLMGGAFAVVWLALGFAADIILIAAGSAAIQMVMGFLAAFGGRRTDLNKTEVSQLLGLRRYLAAPSKEELAAKRKADPDYFFKMLPYAMALGVPKQYTAAFGKSKIHQCPYMVTQVHGKRPAQEWTALLLRVTDAMDARFRRMERERWSAVRTR